MTGRRYGLFDYVGDPRAERVIVIMGSGAETVDETVEYLTARGEKVGVLKVRLFRPFSGAAFLAALPPARPRDCRARPHQGAGRGRRSALSGRRDRARRGARRRHLPFASEPRVVAGRYGLSSKEFTPAMVKAIFDELAQRHGRSNHFTVGIVDDVTHTSLAWDPTLRTEADDVDTALFYGLGADGTVGANKNSIKIIGEETDRYVQGYFVYDSKKSGAITISHLRSSPRPIRSAYLITNAKFVACHQFEFLDKIDVLEHAAAGAVFLLNAPYAADERLGAPAARGAAADDREKHPLLRHRRLRCGESKPAWAAASTRSCRPASSRSPACCRATRRSPRSRKRSRRPTASGAPRSCAGTSRRSIRRSRICTRSRCPTR